MQRTLGLLTWSLHKFPALIITSLIYFSTYCILSYHYYLCVVLMSMINSGLNTTEEIS